MEYNMVTVYCKYLFNFVLTSTSGDAKYVKKLEHIAICNKIKKIINLAVLIFIYIDIKNIPNYFIK